MSTITTTEQKSQENLFKFRKLFATYVNRSELFCPDIKPRKPVRLFLTEHSEKLAVYFINSTKYTLISELHLWCQDVIDRVYLSQFALELGETEYAKVLMTEALSLVADYEDGYAVLKANEKHRLLSPENITDLFKETLDNADNQKEHLDLVIIGELLLTSGESIAICLKKALEYPRTFYGVLELANYYSLTDKEKSWNLYVKSFEFWEDAGSGEDILYFFNKCNFDEEKTDAIIDRVMSHK